MFDKDDIGRRAQENANLIWNAANSLFGAFKPHEYGLVILPMCVIKRFNDCLLSTHQAVIETNEKYKTMGQLKASFLKRASGYQFYNVSKFTFDTLKADPENIDDNFDDYLHGFSDNVLDILNRMNFFAQIDRMKEAKVLYQVIVDFSGEDLDMSPSRISTVDMGYIFENLVRRFSESYDEEAGSHFTSRDIIYLMCDLLLVNAELAEDEDGVHCTVYDMAMGTSQMLTCMEERITDKFRGADVQKFGQEINPFTMGIAEADMLIRGGDPDNMKFGDTLSDDQFTGYKFDFVISNPPFGIDWKREAASVEKENKLGEAGRFAPGLPQKSDGQMLFLLNGISKLKADTGKMAIIQNGSSLFNGDAGSGPSEIRRYILEHDWLDAIVQLPTDSFYNTGIPTYVWIIDKTKPQRNPGKVLLINASACYVTRRKAIGNKRVDISDECRATIVEAYRAYKNGTFGTEDRICRCIVKESTDFGYKKITIERPLRDAEHNPILKKGCVQADSKLRDTENVPLTVNTDDYFRHEVLPYVPDAWIDRQKTKIGYEIPMASYFYSYQAPESSEEIVKRINVLEEEITGAVNALFHKEG
ncbi:MAG: type I restriction-modification system subunit M [Lachnospiraceae bacterium]|nr:type I restriction-modification system subunit M [Lachnospiraceae bacterium]